MQAVDRTQTQFVKAWRFRCSSITTNHCDARFEYQTESAVKHSFGKTSFEGRKDHLLVQIKVRLSDPHRLLLL